MCPCEYFLLTNLNFDQRNNPFVVPWVLLRALMHAVHGRPSVFRLMPKTRHSVRLLSQTKEKGRGEPHVPNTGRRVSYPFCQLPPSKNISGHIKFIVKKIVLERFPWCLCLRHTTAFINSLFTYEESK